MSSPLGGPSDAVAALELVPPFTSASAEALAAIAGHAELVEVDAGEVVVRQGDVADELLVVVDGQLDATLEGEGGTRQPLATLAAGDVIGEIAVVAGGRRTATVTAATDARLVRISPEGLAELTDRSQPVAAALTDLARRRLRETQLIAHLARTFPEIDEAATADVRSHLEWRSVPAGQVLFRQGDPGDAAYVLVSGRLRAVVEDGDGPPEVIGEIGRGELVGEMALLEGGGRSATVYAVRDSELARLPQPVFEQLLERYPRAMLEVARTVLGRTRRRAAAAWAREITITLLGVHDEVDLSALTAELAHELDRHGATAHLDRARVDAELGRPGVADSADGEPGALRVGQWLEEAEGSHDHLLLRADADWSHWTRRAARQADHVVVVADAQRPPDRTDLERALDDLVDIPERRRRRSLVLVHPPDADLPRGTAAWLDAREVDDHFHLRRGHAGDLARLARHLAGRALGLALSGGGARGFGHLGVSRALREHGLAPDMIVGASMGCAIGVLLALDHPDDATELAGARESFARLLDYTLPVVGLVKGGRIARSAQHTTDHRDVEDLWIPFRGVSTNLTRSEVAVHRRGPVDKILRASVAIPGVIPPVAFGEDLHIDGGVLNNLPMDVARREVRSGTVLAVDVAPPRGPRAKDDPGLSVSGVGLLARRLTPGMRAPRVPGIANVVLRSMIAASTRDRDQALRDGIADHYLSLDLTGVGLLEFDALDRAVEAGYAAAVDRIAAIASDHRPEPART